MARTRPDIVYFVAPLIGIILFICLYIIAAMQYPGGSDYDPHAVGFSWRYNYWCELLAANARNGAENSSRPWTITAMFVLAVSLSAFWHLCAIIFQSSNAKWIRYAGIGSMLIAVFLFIGPHDLVMMSAGLLGLFALLLVVLNLFKEKANVLASVGLLCIAICGLNNYIYYTGHWLNHLAFIQKITFGLFLYWFLAVTVYLYRRQVAK